jgi:hypothetical protein
MSCHLLQLMATVAICSGRQAPPKIDYPPERPLKLFLFGWACFSDLAEVLLIGPSTAY